MAAAQGDLASSFSNLRLAFSAPVADDGLPGLTSPEELLLGAAVAAYCTAFMSVAGQMALDVADVAVEGELVRDFDEVAGNVLKAIRLEPKVRLRTGIGFEKVHDMFRRASVLAKNRSPVLQALGASVKLTIDPTFGEAR